jgi:hypothetical protein
VYHAVREFLESCGELAETPERLGTTKVFNQLDHAWASLFDDCSAWLPVPNWLQAKTPCAMIADMPLGELVLLIFNISLFFPRACVIYSV